MENSIGLLKKLKIELPDDAAIPLLYIYLEKKWIQKIHAPQCSLQHYLQIAKIYNQPKCSSTEK